MAPGWDCHVHVFDGGLPSRAGHYAPQTRRLGEVEAEGAASGIGHLVLVQPSVYGTDNRLLLNTLAARPGRHRGVVVVAPDIADAELDTMHALGVRGVRFNLVSPVGHAGDPAQHLLMLAPRLRQRGWHVQWYAPADSLAALAALQQRTGLTFVLDHLAGVTATSAAGLAAWDGLARLAAAGAWVKLSGWYRLGALSPFETLHSNIRRVAALFGSRRVWGSDWPHTGQSPPPSYAASWQPVPAALGAEEAHHVRCVAPLALYR